MQAATNRLPPFSSSARFIDARVGAMEEHMSFRFIPAWALLALCCLFDNSPAIAAGVSPIVVTATRLPTPRDEVGSSVIIITAAEIAQRQYRSVTDALKSVPGLSIVGNGGIGKLTTVFSRGTEVNHTLFLLDGIELNDPSSTDGLIDLSHIYIGDVERIEILNGPQGTLYGSDAIGAVIQVITKKGEGPPSAYGRIEAGSFNTFHQAAGVSGGKGLLSYSFNLQHVETGGLSALGEEFRQSDGTLDDDRHENLTAGTRLVFDVAENFSVDFTGRYSGTENDLDLNSSYVSDDSDSHGQDDQVFLGLNGRLALFDGKTEHRLGLGYTAIDRETWDDFDPINSTDAHDERNRGWKRKLELQNDFYGLDNHVLTLGLETEEDRVRSKVASVYDFFGPSRIDSSVNAAVRNKAAYFQDQFSYAELSGTVGVRIDDHELFKRKTTYRVAISRRLPSIAARVRGSLATGFKAPTVNQLFVNSVSSFGLFSGNPDLRPEKSRGWEVGFDKQLQKHAAAVGLTYYRNRIDDLITFTSDFSSNENRDQVNIEGVEAYAEADMTDTLSVDLGYSFTQSIDEASGLNLLRRPLRKASLSLDYVPAAAATLSLETVYTGPRYDIDALTYGRLRKGGYTLVNVAGSWQLKQHLLLHGRISNLFDRELEDPDGFKQPGIGLYAGLTLSN